MLRAPAQGPALSETEQEGTVMMEENRTSETSQAPRPAQDDGQNPAKRRRRRGGRRHNK